MFRSGVVQAVGEMAQYIGKDLTKEKILPVIIDLLKDENSEVRLNCI